MRCGWIREGSGDLSNNNQWIVVRCDPDFRKGKRDEAISLHSPERLEDRVGESFKNKRGREAGLTEMPHWERGIHPASQAG